VSGSTQRETLLFSFSKRAGNEAHNSDSVYAYNSKGLCGEKTVGSWGRANTLMKFFTQDNRLGLDRLCGKGYKDMVEALSEAIDGVA